MEPFARRLRVPAVEAMTAWEDREISGAYAVASALQFEAFYSVNRAKVVRALAVTLGDRDLAAEAADEALTRAYLRWDRLQQLDNPAGWVYRVGLNWARSVVRRNRGPIKVVHESVSVEQPGLADAELHEALVGLTVKHRSVVVCRFLLGRSEQQTADALDLRAGTVKSRLHRALKELEERLEHLRPEARS
jgi:RNA polymerase sigma factor (sigma-70 family)